MATTIQLSPSSREPQMIGERYARLTVLKRAGSDKRKHARWLCRCDCGKETVVRGDHLRNGRISSCGCYHDEFKLKDETGSRYGRLVVLGRAKSGDHGALWRCQCDCGKEVIVRGHALRSGKTHSCGCLNREAIFRGRFIDLTGRRLGRWTVLEYVGTKNHQARWLCQCECGNEKVVGSAALRRGESSSCGCLKIESLTVHGQYANGGCPDYPEEWTGEFRERVRARDNYTCQVCGEPQNGRALHVHHIDYNRENTTMGNCTALCNSCHTRTGRNRGYWQDRLQAMQGGPNVD